MFCKNCGLSIVPIYQGFPEEGYVHVAPSDKPNHQYCNGGRTYAELEPALPSDHIDYCDRPFNQADQAAYDAYMVREAYNAALTMMLAVSQGCVDRAAEGVAAWTAVNHA